jgi:hypothetical protein
LVVDRGGAAGPDGCGAGSDGGVLDGRDGQCPGFSAGGGVGGVDGGRGPAGKGGVLVGGLVGWLVGWLVGRVTGGRVRVGVGDDAGPAGAAGGAWAPASQASST